MTRFSNRLSLLKFRFTPHPLLAGRLDALSDGMQISVHAGLREQPVWLFLRFCDGKRNADLLGLIRLEGDIKLNGVPFDLVGQGIKVHG